MPEHTQHEAAIEAAAKASWRATHRRFLTDANFHAEVELTRRVALARGEHVSTEAIITALDCRDEALAEHPEPRQAEGEQGMHPDVLALVAQFTPRELASKLMQAGVYHERQLIAEEPRAGSTCRSSIGGGGLYSQRRLARCRPNWRARRAPGDG